MGIAVGIDLGTTNSAIARLDRHGKPMIIPNAEGSPITPSVICFRDGNHVIGEEAKDLQALGKWPVAAFFKRQMGDALFLFHADGVDYTATDLSALILRKIKKEAEASLGEPVARAVITVPAYFRDAERKATIAAGQAAGLEVLQIINEPTAAAVAYGFGAHGAGQRLVVCDLGGGTFDVTLLELTKDGVQVITSHGDHQLGGKDWDDRIIEFLAAQFRDEFGVDPLEDAESLADLLVYAEVAKKRLSTIESTTISITHNGCRGRYTFDRAKFEELTADLMERTVSLTKRVLDDMRIRPQDVDGVLLVGGSTRMPMVHRFVNEVFGKDPMPGVNVDEAVVLGAAILADSAGRSAGAGHISGRKASVGGLSIRDVTTHGLGVIAINESATAYENSIILPKNTAIPCKISQSFHQRSGRTGRSGLEFFMTQGESSSPADVAFVGKYVISHDADNGCFATSNIDLEYGYDVNGTVCIRATDKGSGTVLKVEQEVLPSDVPGRFLGPPPKNDPYTLYRGVNSIPLALRDGYGNAAGATYDLAHDDAFKGLRIAVLQLCAGGDFDFVQPSKALAEKGFVLDRHTSLPSAKELSRILAASNQLWLISGISLGVTKEHAAIIRDFFNAGHGVYLWGDNDPLNADATFIANELLGASLSGNYQGDQVVGVRSTRDHAPNRGGMVEGHLVCTGLEYVYEGITIASVSMGTKMSPIVYASDGSVVVAGYDRDGRRAILDGGFTRLYYKWDTAGTGRYVKNAAAWLANYERFGDALFSD